MLLLHAGSIAALAGLAMLASLGGAWGGSAVGKGNPSPFTLRDVQTDRGTDDDGSKAVSKGKPKSTTTAPQAAPKPPRR